MTPFGIIILGFVISAVAVCLGIVWHCTEGNLEKIDLTEYMKDIYGSTPKSEVKPCPTFVPPAAKPKKIGDLEPNLCPNCGASFDPSTLHCEYCDTWFREKKKPIAMEVDNGVVYVDSENKISIRGANGNAMFVELDNEKETTEKVEDAIQNFAKVVHDYGINLKDLE